MIGRFLSPRGRAWMLVLGVSSAPAFGVWLSACGGETPAPATPANANDAGPAPPPAAVGTAAPIPVQHADVTGAAKSGYDRGYKAFAAGDLQGAKQAFTEATRSDSAAPAPHYALGTVLERLGDTAGAQQEYRAAFTSKTDYELAIGAYAMSLANSGHTGEADTFLTDKQQKFSTSPAIATYLAEVKSIAGNSGDAQRLAQSALAMNPDFKPAMVVIAHDHFRARRIELANYALTAILDGFGEGSPARDKDNPDAHLLRGLIEKESGRRAAAMADFDAARAKRPDMVEALIQVGVMKLEAGNVVEATPLLESAVRFAPNSPLAHLNLGDAYRLGGRIADAKKEFDVALSMDSSLAVVHYDLGLLYLFSASVPGTSASDQIATAIRELGTYKTMRGARAIPGSSDDIDELLSRANAKQAELKAGAAAAAAPPPAPAAPAPSAGARPAVSDAGASVSDAGAGAKK
jgi:Tfp pilus assembly protein PilF